MDERGTNRSLSRIGLGTAQFGMDYGITNQDGQPSLEEVAKIFQVAKDTGVRVVDTAAVYGNSEKVIGQTLDRDSHFRIITKMPPLRERALSNLEIDLVKKSLVRSLRRLQVSCVDGLLVHHSGDLLADGAEWLWETLCEFREKKLVNKIGVSVYNEEQLAEILENYEIDLVQLPLNVLDQRWARSGQLEELQQAGD